MANFQGSLHTSIISSSISGNIRTVQTINVTVGGLVGLLNNSKIENSYSNGDVFSPSSAGGLIGAASNSTIIRSYSNSTVFGSIQAGGLAGYIRSNSIIEHSFSTGDVESDRDINSGRTGGLVSQNWNSIIINSYAKGDVKGASYMVGGLVGNNRGDIISSFAKGNVTSTNDMVGGLVGRNSENSTIINSYSFGNVVGVSQIGGLVGLNRDNAKISTSYSKGKINGNQDIGGLVGINAASIEYSYWNTETSEISTGVGRGSSDGVTGLTTSEIQGSSAKENMSEFDWETVWNTTSGYPILRWQEK